VIEARLREVQASAGHLLHDQAAVAVEIHCAASHEGAHHRDDILTRRTRISIQTCDRGLQAARSTAPIVAPILGWARAAIDSEIDQYDARVSAELESQTQPDDRTADAARMGAADVRRLGLDSESGVIASYENAPVVSLDDRRRAD